MKGRDLYPWGWWTAGVIGTPVLLLAIGLTIVLIFADEMDFDLARWWWLMGIGPLAGLWILWTVARRRRSVQAFASASLAPLLVEGFSPVRPVWKASLQVAALVMIAWALIGPRWGTYLEKHRVYGVDVVVALDVSKSMLAEDVRPNRLERAKQVIRQQLTERTVLGRANRLALIAFAGSTSLKVPLSTDLSAFRNRLEQLTVGSAPRGGTALAKAIRNAADLFVRSPEKATKVILLFTDGEDHEGDPVAAAKEAYESSGIRTFTVAVGDPSRTTGAKIPLHQGERIKPLLYDGQIVFSRVDPTKLEAIARAGGGRFATIRDVPRLVEAIGAMHRTALTTEQRITRRPRYQWFVAAALLMLALESGIRPRRPRAEESIPRVWQQEAA